MDRNDREVEKTVSMHSHAFEQSYKCQIVTDTKSHNALHFLHLKSMNLRCNVIIFFSETFKYCQKNLGWDKNNCNTKKKSTSFSELINVKQAFYYK